MLILRKHRASGHQRPRARYGGHKAAGETNRPAASRKRGASRRGAGVLEFTFTFLPLLALLFVEMDVSWGIFVKSTLEYSVRAGVRRGITITGAQATAAGSDLTSMVKSTVQSNALGLLAGTDGRSKIKVHYFLPPAPESSGALVDVSGQSNGNLSLNVLQVTIEGYSTRSLFPRFYNWTRGADMARTAVGAYAADLIEPSRDLPPIGAAP
jgi:Flp pilus assembly protein TadG